MKIAVASKNAMTDDWQQERRGPAGCQWVTMSVNRTSGKMVDGRWIGGDHRFEADLHRMATTNCRSGGVPRFELPSICSPRIWISPRGHFNEDWQINTSRSISKETTFITNEFRKRERVTWWGQRRENQSRRVSECINHFYLEAQKPGDVNATVVLPPVHRIHPSIPVLILLHFPAGLLKTHSF